MDLAKSVKAIALPQYVPSTFDRRLIKLKNQVQRLMEAHLALTQPTQANKITTSCEIYSGPHDTQYCMDDPEKAFVKYASSRTDEVGDARLTKFKADLKQQQSEMTNKIDTVLKAITDRIAGALPSDTVKNPKLSTSPVFSARSYPIIDPQCSSHPSTSINVIKAHSKEATISNQACCDPGWGSKCNNQKNPNQLLKLHLNLLVLEVIAYAPIYNTILNKYVESLELGKNSNMWESEDLIKNPINWNKPPKDGDRAWHAKIRLIDPDEEEFTKTLQSIPTTRKLFEREMPMEIIDLDHFYDT
uniref:MAK10-like protein n=1 Tax=Tanacetum cinerariifolium TaxID=118510 RepID=A0A6L2K540_TANCI|nr:MAK10-like protein [Tanacetum cinerariifolium]GEY72969.1 MAK10-like protein [Tanacetum cinerariifolium]